MTPRPKRLRDESSHLRLTSKFGRNDPGLILRITIILVQTILSASCGFLISLLLSNVCTKANRILGFLRRNLYSCPQEVKEAAYKGLVRPVLDYGSSVWDPPGVVLQEELESVQKRAARFVTGNYNYETGSMTGILGQLKWECLKKRRKDNRLILLYKGLKGKASVPTDDLIPKTRRCRSQHSMAFQLPLPIRMFIKVASSPRLSGIGMPSPILWSHPLKMQRIVLLSSLLWWELGTNSLSTGAGKWLSFRRFTSKLSWYWSWDSSRNIEQMRKLTYEVVEEMSPNRLVNMVKDYIFLPRYSLTFWPKMNSISIFGMKRATF